MKIGRHYITITKNNWKTFFRVYTMYITVFLFWNDEKTKMQILFNAIFLALIPFIIEVILGNYYRNNLDKEKENWFWKHHQYLD